MVWRQMLEVVYENGVCKVFGDEGWVTEVVEAGFGAEMVESGDDIVSVVGICVAIGLVGLMAEENDNERVGG